MTPLAPVAAQASAPIAAAPTTPAQAGTTDAAAPATSFSEMLANGLNDVQDKVNHADNLVRAFALGEDVPIHQVTVALEEARLSVELALQVRQRLVDGYHELMNMQL
jgi:flagellar hook-basal body complex protein FliE